MIELQYIAAVAAALLAGLPYAYMLGRMVGIGYFEAKLNYHRKVLAEHSMLGLDLDYDNEREEGRDGRAISTQSS